MLQSVAEDQHFTALQLILAMAAKASRNRRTSSSYFRYAPFSNASASGILNLLALLFRPILLSHARAQETLDSLDHLPCQQPSFELESQCFRWVKSRLRLTSKMKRCRFALRDSISALGLEWSQLLRCLVCLLLILRSGQMTCRVYFSVTVVMKGCWCNLIVVIVRLRVQWFYLGCPLIGARLSVSLSLPHHRLACSLFAN